MLMSPQITADPLALGEQYQLGNHRATYKPSTTCGIIALSIMLAIGCVATLISLFFVVSSASFFPLIFTAVGLLFAGGALFGIIQTYRNRVLRVFVYDYGLIHVGRQSVQAIRWQNVQAVWHNVIVQTHSSTDSQGHTSTSRTTSHIYTVSCADGISLRLDETFARLRQLGKTIELETARYLFPAALNSYQTTRAVTFGPLMVTPQGLYRGPDLLPWGDVKSIKIDEDGGHIAIRKQRKLFDWASVKLADVPNVEVFRMLVHHITGVRP